MDKNETPDAGVFTPNHLSGMQPEERMKAVLDDPEDVNRRLAQVLDSIAEAFYSVDSHWRLTYVSREAEKRWRRGSGKLLGTVLWDIFPQPEKTVGWKMHHETMETRRPVHWETFSPNLETWIETAAYPTADGGIAAFSRDITERRKAEETLSFQADILNSVHDAIVAADGDCLIIYWNGMAEKMFGWTAEEALGKHVGDLLRTRVPGSPWEAEPAGTPRDDYYEGEAVYRRKDGSEIYTDVHSAVTRGRDGTVTGFITSFRDITVQKEAERLLRKSEERLRAFMTASTDVIYRMSPDWRTMIELHGKGFLADTDQPDADWLGKYIYPDDRPHVKEVLESCVRDKKIYELEHRVLRADGSVGWTYACAVPIPDEKGEITEWFGAASDVTKRRQAEEELRESKRKALELVTRLEEADRNKNRFLSVFSHELRNPLATIAAGLSVMDCTDDREQAANAREIIRRQTRQLCKMVDDQLELTRITQNKVELHRETVNLNQIVRYALGDVRGAFQEKNLQLCVNMPKKPIFLYADPVRITQCVSNCLNNSFKFTPEGGTVWISLETENGKAVVSVRDNGIGIGQDLLGQLFTPFIQGDHSPDRSGNNGLGLGLSIVKAIVELHGGTVTAASTGLGQGALFTMTLPATEESAAAPESLDRNSSVRALSVLLIEDNRDLSALLGSFLEILGHKVTAAYSGAEGVRQARIIRPDIVFCDIGLPGMNGYEVAKLIREDGAQRDVFLVALTGYTRESDIRLARESGFDRYLAKPMDAAKLRQVLDEYGGRGKPVQFI
jgi:PAS domain S-box-containing protein